MLEVSEVAESARESATCVRRANGTFFACYANVLLPHSNFLGPGTGPQVNKMRLTLHTDYALRALIRIAIAEGKLITINDIAQSFDISKQHLMKVVNDLSRKGYLDTVRGRNGGIRLRRRPRDINVGQVVRDTEEIEVIGCLAQRGYCPIQRICVLRGVLRDATEAFLAELDAYTLADLIKPRRELSSLLLDQSAARIS